MENKKITEEEWESLKTTLNNLIHELNGMFGWFNEEELKNTPRRMMEFYKELHISNNFVFTKFPAVDRDQMITYTDIPFFSLCAHHHLPFFGKVSISYLPDKYIGGASKFSRLTKKYASKPTVQEILTKEITDQINEILKPRFVFVRIEARHLCEEMRGIRSVGEVMKTSSLRFIPEIEGKLENLKQEATQ